MNAGKSSTSILIFKHQQGIDVITGSDQHITNKILKFIFKSIKHLVIKLH